MRLCAKTIVFDASALRNIFLVVVGHPSFVDGRRDFFISDSHEPCDAQHARCPEYGSSCDCLANNKARVDPWEYPYE